MPARPRPLAYKEGKYHGLVIQLGEKMPPEQVLGSFRAHIILNDRESQNA